MSSSVTNRVGEIFTFAGQAFTKLGELTMHLETSDVNLSGQKWDEEDIEMFKLTIKKFSEDLNRISENIKNKTVNQLKSGIKRKVQDSKGITPVSSSAVKRVAKGNQSPISSPLVLNNQSKVITKPIQSTINSFNASSMDSVNDEVDG